MMLMTGERRQIGQGILFPTAGESKSVVFKGGEGQMIMFPDYVPTGEEYLLTKDGGVIKTKSGASIKTKP